ncbi:polysaccharide deacetylase family sporulation protein PdaB [Paenibacillus amylolyticus]|uniref:Polysaccharide deacetylase family sporulation protein PdaB n=1 Tax=Paenibacillus amylolyticus TaxID=1451 RepID=A0AAP5LSD1_PAEAM|nr:polysaccharide deacetylase family sporulation protein PdaB [Paenibacillus amylolyticus]MDR6727308.1 polysaccharide deacetylase family sporulation protein PdaB [Paenibacillus amylolyticus]
MNSFYVFSGKKIKRYLIVLAAAVFAIGIIYLESGNVSVFSEDTPSAVYSVPTEKKVIALTFDISWGDKRTEPILKVLKENKIEKATFFLSSPWSKTHPEIVTSIKEAGYEIGSHGHRHENYSSLTEEEIRKEISTAHSILTDLTGKEPNLLRLPNGDFDKRVLQVASNLNYQVVQWDTDSQDWKNPGVQTIVDRVVSKAHPGDIVLLHASDSSKQTHEALPVIIDKLRNQGYEFVTVSELLNHSSTKGSEVRDQASAQ